MNPVAETKGVKSPSVPGRMLGSFHNAASAPLKIEGTEQSYLWNWIVTVICEATGCPFNSPGWYFHRRSASRAAWRSTGGPEITFVDTTFPAGPIEASTTTLPSIPLVLAIGGYTGKTEDISFGGLTWRQNGGGGRA